VSDVEKSAVIRRLNDDLRSRGTGGRVVMTRGLDALGPATVSAVLQAVRGFSEFTTDNDPHGEHDCAVLTVDGLQVLWKIDYYDVDLRCHSPDPADPSLTNRVLTIMLAEEY
jgi:hypothetical protein